MADKAWKAYERWIARNIFNSERNPLSGGNNTDDKGNVRRGDVIDPTGVLNIECKHYQNPTINNWVKKAAEETKNTKAAIVFVHKKNRDYTSSTVSIPLEDFLEIKDEYIDAMKNKYRFAKPLNDDLVNL